MTQVLSGVDLNAQRGEITAVIGPNGAGKTTTLACAQGLIRPSAGQVQLLGEDPYGADAALRSRVGVMLQDGGLPQSVTPSRLLKHVARFHQYPWAFEDLVARLDLGAFLSTPIRRLSGGQKQRTALAAALIGNPEVVFLDEPSSGLDPQSRHLVYELIEHLRERELGIILTTHLLEEAQRLADSVYILKSGTVVRHGTVAELTNGHTNDAHSPSTQHSTVGDRQLRFRSPRKLHDAELTSAPLPVTCDGDSGLTFTVASVTTAEDLNRLSAWWVELDLMPEEISFEARTLEDVFWEVSLS